ncbi:MAG: twin-arginine translocase TatA/TatE family subunit [Bdellovibrionia bacterium]
MFGLSLGHLLIVSLVVLLFGHRRLPELGHALGKGLGAFKNGLEGKGWENSSQGKLEEPLSDRSDRSLR